MHPERSYEITYTFSETDFWAMSDHPIGRNELLNYATKWMSEHDEELRNLWLIGIDVHGSDQGDAVTLRFHPSHKLIHEGFDKVLDANKRDT